MASRPRSPFPPPLPRPARGRASSARARAGLAGRDLGMRRRRRGRRRRVGGALLAGILRLPPVPRTARCAGTEAGTGVGAACRTDRAGRRPARAAQVAPEGGDTCGGGAENKVARDGGDTCGGGSRGRGGRTGAARGGEWTHRASSSAILKSASRGTPINPDWLSWLGARRRRRRSQAGRSCHRKPPSAVEVNHCAIDTRGCA